MSAKLRRLQGVLAARMHFVNALHTYLIMQLTVTTGSHFSDDDAAGSEAAGSEHDAGNNEARSCAWHRLKAAIRAARTLAELREAHTTYLAEVRRRCLLG